MKKDSKQRRFLSINKGKASNIVEKNKVVAVTYLILVIFFHKRILGQDNFPLKSA